MLRLQALRLSRERREEDKSRNKRTPITNPVEMPSWIVGPLGPCLGRKASGHILSTPTHPPTYREKTPPLPLLPLSPWGRSPSGPSRFPTRPAGAFAAGVQSLPTENGPKTTQVSVGTSFAKQSVAESYY